MNLLKELRRRVSAALQTLVDDPAPFAEMVRPSQRGKGPASTESQFGDYQANCAMPLAGKLKQKSRDIADQITANLNVDDLCEQVEVAGPGFINFRIRDEWLAEQVRALGATAALGVESAEAPRHYIVDFSSPNVAKPMHVGHLRSTVIGDALVRILRFLGHKVTSDNHIGDWGTQFGMIIYGYKHFRDAAAYERNAVGELARLYRLVNQLGDYHEARETVPKLEQRITEQEQAIEGARGSLDPKDKSAKKRLGKFEADLADLRDQVCAAQQKVSAIDADSTLKAAADAHPDIAVQARLETAKLHAGDAENTALWNQFLPACLEMLHAMYDRLGITFDLELGESYYQPLLGAVVDDLEAKGLASESDGARCVFIEGNNAPFIVRKQDGAFTYATTDLATIKYRVDELHADEILYVVDARQGEHFKLLFETARLWGYEKTILRHVSFGTILGEDKRPFKTRAGDTVGLESLIDEAVMKAREVVDQNDEQKPTGSELDDSKRQAIAEAVGIGGLKYADLRHNRDSDYVFSWQKMLATDGDTATYIQYAHARVCGIFRKGGIERSGLSTAAILLAQPEERALVLQLVRFAEAVDDVAMDYRPNLLTQYLFELANTFSGFFVNCPVLKAETDELRAGRLHLCDLTARVLETGLGLLGIAAPPQM